MDTPVTSTGESGISKNVLIVILVLLLIFSFLGINILNILGNFIQSIIGVFGPLVSQILSVFGYTTGVIIDKSADVVTSVGTAGVEIAGGTLNSVGDLLISASQGNINQQAKNQLDQSLSGSGAGIGAKQAQPDSTANPIQNPISSNKTQWCLVGEYQGRRGCIEVADQNKCLSGQIFPSQQMCVNPAMFSNANHPLKSIRE
jgi:hypothetical protein